MRAATGMWCGVLCSLLVCSLGGAFHTLVPSSSALTYAMATSGRYYSQGKESIRKNLSMSLPYLAEEPVD